MLATGAKDKESVKLLRFILLFVAVALGIFFLVRAVLTLIEPSRAYHVADKAPSRAVKAGVNRSNSIAIDPSFDAFHRASGQATPVTAPVIGEDAPETDLNLTLKGRRASGDGGGSATLKLPDGSEDSFLRGETILRNVSLEAVYPTHIIISRGGTHERVTFERASSSGLLQASVVEGENDLRVSVDEVSQSAKASKTTTRRLPVASSVAGPKTVNISAQDIDEKTRRTLETLTPERFFQIVRPAPVRRNGSLLGYRLRSNSAELDLQALGVQRGDLVTHIGSVDLRPLSLSATRDVFEGASQSSVLPNLTVSRNGEPINVSLTQ